MLTGYAEASNNRLNQCGHEECVRKIILSPDAVDVDEKACKVLEGKPAASIFKEDLGMLCRLFIARKKADLRKKFRCAYDFYAPNPDYSSELSTISHWLYSKVLYKKLPKAKKIIPRILSNANNNSTIYHSYVLSRFESMKTRRDKVSVEFHTYFCIAEVARQQFYIPYFMALKVLGTGKNNDRRGYVIMQYIATPPYWEQPIIRQIPRGRLKNKYEDVLLKDMNDDDLLDLVYLDSPKFKRFLPGVCLAKIESGACEVLDADLPTPKSKIFSVRAVLNATKSRIDVIYQDIFDREPEERYTYEVVNGKIKANFNKPE